MLYRVTGRAGSGKTRYIFDVMEELITADKHFIVIVPEQQTLEYERMVFKAFGSRANMCCEVLNFERLPNRTYRDYGGLAVKYIDNSGKNIIMSMALENAADKLCFYDKKTQDIGFITEMLKITKHFKSNGITTDMLEDAVKNIGDEVNLSKKIHDLAFIIKEYNKFYSEKFADSCDTLFQYSEHLKEMPFFKNKTVFIDSFLSFTETEYFIIDEIAKQCDNIYVAITRDPNEISDMFLETDRVFKRLAKNKNIYDIPLIGNKRVISESLKFLEKNCWNYHKNEFTEATEDISIIKYETPFDEAEAAVYKIYSLVYEKSCRFKDIALIVRSPETYKGILDAAFEKNGIPFFFAEKDNITTKPLIVFMLSAIEAAVTNYAPKVMKRYIKSGFCGLTNRQINLLTNYIDTWNIRGTMWEQPEWNFNPRGFNPDYTEYDNYILYQVNEAKNIVIKKLQILVNNLEGAKGSEAAKAIYNHFIICGVDKKLRKSADILRSSDADDSAQKLVQLWDIAINILDQLYLVCPDKILNPKKLLMLLKLMCEESRVGAVPVSCDAVMIGGADRVKTEGIKHILILGLNDGVFPAKISQNSLFNDDEAITMEEYGIITKSFQTSYANEKLFFYRASASSSESVNFFYSDNNETRPSVAVMRLKSLFPNLKVKNFGENDKDFLFSKESARENIYRIQNKTLKRLLLQSEFNYEALLLDFPLSGEQGRIEMPNIKSLNLSASKLETYTKCAFKYFGDYVLNLKDNRKADMSPMETGSFLHKIFEETLKERIVNGKFIKLSKEEIEISVDKITDDYIALVCGGNEFKTQRFKYNIKNLKHTAVLMLLNICEELDESIFTPEFFEYAISFDSSTITELQTENGLKLYFNGKIDRIDTLVVNDKKLIRITDYKIKNIEFQPKTLMQGLELQLLLYLFAICSDKNNLPEAAYYTPVVALENSNEKSKKSEEEILKEAVKRTGIMLSNTKPDGFYKSFKLLDWEKYNILKNKICSYINKISQEIVKGNISASPLKSKKFPCEYCNLKAICRVENIDTTFCNRETAIDLQEVF